MHQAQQDIQEELRLIHAREALQVKERAVST